MSTPPAEPSIAVPEAATRAPIEAPLLRVAVVGTGQWGEQHARIFAHRADTRLCAVVGRSPAKARARAARYGTTAYVDLDEMLDAEQPDLVTVCLPNEAHFEPTMRLIKRGAALLVEKPLVFDLREADALLDEAAARNLFFAINLNHRFAEPVQLARRAIAAGELGELVFADWRFGGEPNFGTSPDANLIETQVHGLDMLEYLCGPIDSVMGQQYDRSRAGINTTLAVALKFANGAVGTLLGTYDSSYAYPDTHRLEINGTRARVLIQDTVRRFTLSRAGDETSLVWEAGYFNDEARSFHNAFDRHVEALLAALRSGSEPPVHARAGRRALELAHAIIRSAADGVRVETAPTR